MLEIRPSISLYRLTQKVSNHHLIKLKNLFWIEDTWFAHIFARKYVGFKPCKLGGVWVFFIKSYIDLMKIDENTIFFKVEQNTLGISAEQMTHCLQWITHLSKTWRELDATWILNLGNLWIKLKIGELAGFEISWWNCLPYW